MLLHPFSPAAPISSIRQTNLSTLFPTHSHGLYEQRWVLRCHCPAGEERIMGRTWCDFNRILRRGLDRVVASVQENDFPSNSQMQNKTEKLDATQRENNPTIADTF
jgi:hypothetical protein